jgi:hypothetical protein
MNENPRSAIHRAGVRSFQALAYLVLLSLPAAADGPLNSLLGCPVPDCIGKWCRDDYCAKKVPCAAVPLCFGRDDYCSKKAPCVSVPLCFGCDNYRRKCLPKVCSRPLGQFLKFGSSAQSCRCAKCNGLPRGVYVAKPVEATAPGPGGDEQLIGAPSRANPQQLRPVIVGVADFKLIEE